MTSQTGGGRGHGAEEEEEVWCVLQVALLGSFWNVAALYTVSILNSVQPDHVSNRVFLISCMRLRRVPGS